MKVNVRVTDGQRQSLTLILFLGVQTFGIWETVS